ncbi:MAG: M23 family metallopeptidase [Pseudomonadota bacterium]
MTGVIVRAALACLAIGLVGFGAPPVALARDDLANRILHPVRAPEHLREALVEQADAAFAQRLLAGEPLAREDVADWLRTSGHALADLLARTGMDPARLLLGAIEGEAPGVGGPFVSLADADTLPELQMTALVDRVMASVPLALPLEASYRLTSGFGPRRDPFRGTRAFHRGIDLAAPRGTPIHATAEGTVIRVGRHGAYGNLVEVDHGNGVRTLYAHLHSYLVKHGDLVRAGQKVGTMGRTGRATGVHLHYEVIVDDRPVDPQRFFEVGRVLIARAS